MRRRVREQSEVWAALSVAGFRGPLFLLFFLFLTVASAAQKNLWWALASLGLTLATGLLLWVSITKRSS